MSPKSGLAVAAVFATGCFSVPPYEPEVRVSYTEAGTGGTATGPGFALRFADGDGFHFPDALMIDGVDVMGHEDKSKVACDAEDGVGLRISPSYRISASSEGERVLNHLVPVLRGPAVVQVRVEWATSFMCNPNRAPGGTSMFTVFPDGRIVRDDTINDPSMMSISPTPCSCGPEDKLFYISPFWAFVRKPETMFYTSDMGPLPLPDSGTDDSNSNYSSACIDGGGYQVGLAWDKFLSTTIRGGDALVAFGKDLKIGEPSLEELHLTSNSAIFIGHTDCKLKATTSRTKEYVDPTALTINGVPDIKPSIHDGIYGGADGGDGKPGIKLATDKADLMGAVDSSFAVWLRFPRSVDGLRAKADGMTGPWYLPQRVDDDSWIIWFRDSNSANRTITIEAL